MSQSTLPLERYLEANIEGQTRRFPVGDGQVCRSGRAVRNTIVLDSSQVSHDHALVDCPDGRGCVFTDLGSVNGTYINCARVAGQQVLKDGDLISIGEFRFVFRQPAHKDAETQDELVKDAFVRLYANTTKEDIRKNRDGIAERLGFLGRVTHGANPRSWLRDLKSRVGETVDYALALE